MSLCWGELEIYHAYISGQMESQSNPKAVLGSGDDSVDEKTFPQMASLAGLSITKTVVNQVSCVLAQQGLNEPFQCTFPSTGPQIWVKVQTRAGPEKLLLPLKSPRGLPTSGWFSSFIVTVPLGGKTSGMVMVQLCASSCFPSFQDLFSRYHSATTAT